MTSGTDYTWITIAATLAIGWHLLKNISEVFERLLNRHRKILHQAVQNVQAAADEVASSIKTTDVAAADDNSSSPPQFAALPSKTKHDRCPEQPETDGQVLYRNTQELKQQGFTINQIRLRVGRHHSTIARLYGADLYPEPAPRKRRKQAMAFEACLRQRWDEGCHNAKRLFREIKAQGYGGSSVTIRRYVRAWREAPASIICKKPLPKVPSPRTVVWLLLKPEARLTDEDRRLIAEIVTLSPTLKRGRELVEEFRRIVRERQERELNAWMEAVAESELVDFENFVTHLRRDEAAVRAGLTHSWSNGLTEGQINRLKYLKPQMFGRANFDLLKARVLHAA